MLAEQGKELSYQCTAVADFNINLMLYLTIFIVQSAY